jgi:hypothetical protein
MLFFLREKLSDRRRGIMKASVIFKRGGYILPATLDGRPLFKDTPENRIKDRAGLMDWYNNKKVRRFIFRPCTAGLIGIDCDVKNGKDGIRELLNIIGLEPEYFTSTPSGGKHYYFFSDGQDYVSLEIKPGLEIKHRAFITIAGSTSEKGSYTAHGDPENISKLPESLRRLIPVRNANPAPLYTPRAGESISLNKIYDTIRKQGLSPEHGNRNNFCFQFARYARKQAHRPDEVLNFLSFLNSPDFSNREIYNAVNSAYRGAR